MWIIKNNKIFLCVAGVVMILSIGILGTLGLNLGIDFTGGALTEVVYEERPEKEVIEASLQALDATGVLETEFGGISLRETADAEGRDGYILRTRDLSEAERQVVEAVLLEVGTGGELARFTSIGPVIGEELKDKAIYAIGAVALVIVLYVAYVFSGIARPVSSWTYGGITILALLHDILVPTAFFAVMGTLFGAEVDVLFVMALLAVLGYSVNDTIVVFDRVRENLTRNQETVREKLEALKGGLSDAEKRRRAEVEVRKEAGVIGVLDEDEPEEIVPLLEPFSDTVGRSVEQTIARSINTSVTTLLALGALWYFGGEPTQNFALVLIVGVLAGTYSSIFFANPLLALLGEKKQSDIIDTI